MPTVRKLTEHHVQQQYPLLAAAASLHAHIVEAGVVDHLPANIFHRHGGLHQMYWLKLARQGHVSESLWEYYADLDVVYCVAHKIREAWKLTEQAMARDWIMAEGRA